VTNSRRPLLGLGLVRAWFEISVDVNVNPGHVRNQGRPLVLSSASAHELFPGGRERGLKSTGALPAAGKKSRAEDRAVRADGARFRTEGGSPAPEIACRRLGLAGALAVAMALGGGTGGCAHKAPPPGTAAASPIAAVALPKTNPEAQAAFDEGVRIMRMGRRHYKDAREPLTRATKLDGRLFEAWHDLGVVETTLGNFDAAVGDFKQALDIQPGARKTVLAYGESLRRSKNGKKAGEVYARWLNSDPNDFEMRARYSQVLRETGDMGSSTLDEALEQARLLLTEAGGDVSHTVIAYNALALTYYKMGKFELAETALHKAADLDPKSAFVWNNLGLVAFERGHDQEAFLDFQKASELDPKYVQARLNKAVVYLDCGDYKRARADLEKATEIDPNDAESQVALGVAARGDGKFDEARKAYERALDIEPDYPPALYDLGVLYMDFDKDPVKAKDFLTQYLQAVGKDDGRRADVEGRLKELK
jgi:tetratricopeptide (TPR) repeat protein